MWRWYSGLIRTSSTSAAKTAPATRPQSALTRKRSQAEPTPSNTFSDIHHVAYEPTVMNAPCAKLSTPISP